MPRYESSQTLATFMRRLAAPFSGFTSQMVPTPDGTVQMSFGQMTFQNHTISIALFTRPSDKRDCVVLSRPLFYVPESGTMELFQQLLIWNNGATESVHFAVDEPLNTINLVVFRNMEGLNFQEFQLCIENLMSVAGNCSDRLQPEYGLMRFM
ncbi:MAG TPA: hypothetical protein VJ521_07600 [Acidobacteriota bacterium]|nr:hypothetical protein [Acidobacteriota bacterium]